MGKAEKYEELIFQLGDLARDRLAQRPQRPRAIERVFKAEEAVVARREELHALEQRMNDEDHAHKRFLEESAEELRAQAEVVQRFRRAVDAAESKVKGLRKQLAGARAELRDSQAAVHQAQNRIGQAEQAGGMDPARLEALRQGVKRQKLAMMRQQRGVEELELALRDALTPAPGQPGAQGILAHRRVLELEEAREQRAADLEVLMADLDAAVVQKEEEIRAAEEFLDQALYLLGEECYAQRLADPELSVFYPRLDKLKAAL